MESVRGCNTISEMPSVTKVKRAAYAPHLDARRRAIDPLQGFMNSATGRFKDSTRTHSAIQTFNIQGVHRKSDLSDSTSSSVGVAMAKLMHISHFTTTTIIFIKHHLKYSYS